MRIALMTAAAAAGLTAVAPADGQTIVDTWRQLRSTVKQLGGKPKPVDGAPPTAAAGGTAPSQRDDGAMVPASVLVDDASDTTLATASSASRRVIGFDIRGLKLGMSPREVGRIAERQGFHRRWSDLLQTTGSFDVEAASLANLRLNRPIEKSSSVQLKAVQGVDATGDELKCEFTLEPAGPRLSRIEYRTRLDGASERQALDALVRRYGPPNGRYDDAVSRSWSNATGPVDSSSALLQANVDAGRMALTLTQSLAYQQAARKRLEDRAQQMASQQGGGVRF